MTFELPEFDKNEEPHVNPEDQAEDTFRVVDPEKARKMAEAGKDWQDTAIEEKAKGRLNDAREARNYARRNEEQAGSEYSLEKIYEKLSDEDLALKLKEFEEAPMSYKEGVGKVIRKIQQARLSKEKEEQK